MSTNLLKMSMSMSMFDDCLQCMLLFLSLMLWVIGLSYTGHRFGVKQHMVGMDGPNEVRAPFK